MRYFTTLVTLALALSFAACSQDAVEEAVPEAPGNVHITLSAPFNAPEHRAPTSAGYTADVDEKRELIESYYVIFTQETSPGVEKIVRVVSEDDVTAADEGIESKRLDLELREGTYKVYAFANIPFDYLNGTDKAAIKPGYNLTVGETMPDLSAATFLIPDGVMKSGETFKDKCFVPCEDVVMVPMTSINGQTINVTERVSQTFGIEVVRMLGKVQFDFRNPTDTELKINRIKMSNLTVNSSTSGSLMLMNYLPLYGDHADYLSKDIVLPGGTTTAALDYTGSAIPLAAHTTSDGDGTASASFYVLESKAKDYTSPDPLDGTFVDNAFNLDFDITPSAAGTYPDNIRYAITKPDNFTTIHRNDWIVIPVTIGEWVMDLTAFSYPPIGGYPSARVSADKSGNFHVAFATPGDISFYPVIHKYYSTTDYYYLNDPNRIVGTVTPVVDDPSGIFTTTPALDPSSGEILATLSGTKGVATITLTVTFKKTLSPETQETLTSKIVVERI